MAKGEVYRGLRGRIQLKDGTTAVIKRGEEMPSNAASGEAKKLRDLGMLGDPFVYEESEDQTAADALLANPEQEAANTVEEVERLSGISATTPNEDLDDFVANSNVDEVVKAASDPETAQALLDAELSVREDDPRKGVVDGLISKGANDPDAEPPAEEPPAEEAAAEGDDGDDSASD